MDMSCGRNSRENVGTENEDPLGTGRGHAVVCRDRDGEARTSSSISMLRSTPPVYIFEYAFLTVTGETTCANRTVSGGIGCWTHFQGMLALVFDV